MPRPNPFWSPEFCLHQALASEHHADDQGVRLLLVMDGDQPVAAWLLRTWREPLGPGWLGPLRPQGTRIEWLSPWDCDVRAWPCLPGWELAAARALLWHLHQQSWDLLELTGQPVHGPVSQALGELHTRRHTHWRRDVEVQPFTEVPLAGLDLPGYYRSLDKHMRSNISRQARKLYATGEPVLVLSEGPGVAGRWMDAYLDLEQRSWKAGTPAAVARSPRRAAFSRTLFGSGAGFYPSFVGVLLDDRLIAGLWVVSTPLDSPGIRGGWCLEMAYDETHRALGPGQLLLLLAAAAALQRGEQFLNYLQNFAYYKHRWGALASEVHNLQSMRRGGPFHRRAQIGSLVRQIRAGLARLRPSTQPNPKDGAFPAPQAPPPVADPPTLRPPPPASSGEWWIHRAGARQRLPFAID